MAEKVCLDTDICIDILNSRARVEPLHDIILDSEIYVTSITVFELYLRATNLNQVSNFLKNGNIISFDENCAVQASNIHKELKSIGKLMEFRDIFIASIAMVNNCKLVTFNKKHFSKIKDLELLDL